jgi:predicted transposase YdaD
VLRDALRDGGVATIQILLRYTLRVAGREPYDRFVQTIIDLATGEEGTMITAAESYFQEGRERGREEGREEGLRRALEHMLVLRFGPLGADARARLERAEATSIQRWLGRVLTASSPDDVLSAD